MKKGFVKYLIIHDNCFFVETWDLFDLILFYWLNIVYEKWQDFFTVWLLCQATVVLSIIVQTSYQTSSPYVKMAESAGNNSENPEKLSTVTSKKFCKGKIDKWLQPYLYVIKCMYT